jgi:hypothetical protein
MRVASQTNRWWTAGVFLDDAATCAHRSLPGTAASSSLEEFLISGPVPGCSRKGLEDGKAEPIILYRLFLDPSGPLN